ncbi:MAG: ATP-dependent DNA helicase, partial [Myxococcaceae bacterium]|nr:ATP-dependent DNA helicase [Myxococcaceae bacterium]
LQMARAVERAFTERLFLLAEAGTGTGKTLAYLVPALLSGRKVVVSTATKTLQDQIFFRDLPLLRERVGLDFDATLLKGRSNYLCLHRLEHFGADGRAEFASREEAALFPEVKAWAERTESGDRAELALPESFAAWERLSTTAQTCLGQRCPQYESCFVTRARRRAEEAQVVVVNHHLFFADLALRSSGRGEGVLPRYDAVIFDEAHALEDAATPHFGFYASSHQVEEVARDALGALPSSDARAGMLDALAARLRSHSEAFFLQLPRAVGLTAEGGSVRLSPEGLARLQPAADALTDSLAALAACAGEVEEPEVAALARRSEELNEGLSFISQAASPDYVYWAEGRGRGVTLRAAPIDIAHELQGRLYGAVDTAVFTSATLTAEGRFDFFAQRLGLLDAESGESVAPLLQVNVASPFDYTRQAALYVPSHLPEPSEPGFAEAVAEELVALTEVTGGRAFALFTSLRNMEAVWALTRDRLPYQVLLQGELPKAALLEAFREKPSVLFAAHSFWEGVDVPGDALSLVVIDRLPFASPGEPLVAARIHRLTERGLSPFSTYQLPQAAISLRQGFGRLIRTREDRGVVAVLDRRLRTKAYGKSFLRSLPRTQRFGERDALAHWFQAT